MPQAPTESRPDLNANTFVEDPNGRLALQPNPFGPPRPPTLAYSFSAPEEPTR